MKGLSQSAARVPTLAAATHAFAPGAEAWCAKRTRGNEGNSAMPMALHASTLVDLRIDAEPLRSERRNYAFVAEPNRMPSRAPPLDRRPLVGVLNRSSFAIAS